MTMPLAAAAAASVIAQEIGQKLAKTVNKSQRLAESSPSIGEPNLFGKW
jgi:hypothetical protein